MASHIDVIQSRRRFLALAGASVVGGMTGFVARGGPRKASAKKPNIVVIVSDDMGYADLGCYGCKDISTPNIDSIARDGVRFTNAYVSCPVCSPTRAGMATGRYQQRFGHEYNTGPPPQGVQEHVGLPLTEITMGNVMKSAGYATGAVGKWHLGIYPHFHPQKRGWDEYFGHLHGGHSYIDPSLSTFNPILRGTEPWDEKEYLTDAFAREAVAFIDKHKSEPFLLYLAFNAVHTPMQSPDRFKDNFSEINPQKRRLYAGMLTAMDEGIGRVLETLKKHGLEENTLLFFINDNGGPERANASDNGPLRGGKNTMWEGGIRVPFMVKWPAKLKGGTTFDGVSIALDILPTAAAAAGARMPQDRPIDGVDLLPYLRGRKQGDPHEALYWRKGPRYALRRGKWKLTHQTDESQLFDLQKDLGEQNDLAGEQPQVLQKLEAEWARWSAQMTEPRWGPRTRRASQPAVKPNR